MGKKECSWDYLTVMDSCNVSQKWRLWCQNDTPSGTAFSFKGERNIAHLLSFVQEIHAFDRKKLAQNPSESASMGVWNLYIGSWMSP